MIERMYRLSCHGQVLYTGDDLEHAMKLYNHVHEHYDFVIMHYVRHEPILEEAEWREIKQARRTSSGLPAWYTPPSAKPERDR
jgi:hypothetical protein